MLFDWLSEWWKRLLLLFALTLFANFASTTPMSFRWLLRKSCLPGFSFVSLLSFWRAGCFLEGLGMPVLGFPRFFLSFRSTCSSGREGGASGGSFGARELASVSSVHSWTGDTGVALIQRTPAFLCPIGSFSSSLYIRRGDGVGEWFGV